MKIFVETYDTGTDERDKVFLSKCEDEGSIPIRSVDTRPKVREGGRGSGCR